MENQKETAFEDLPIDTLADLLREFYGTVRSKRGKEYSASGLINLRAGLNRYLRQPPNKKSFDLMENSEFKQANLVFTGRMRDNKERGLDVSQPKQPIDQEDLEKLFKKYFKPAMENEPLDTEILLHKVFFDILYYTGRRGKEGLRALDKKSFDVQVGPDGKEFFVITFNERTKKNQGDAKSTSARSLHNNRHHVSSQPGNILCPVDSFKNYSCLLNEDNDAFFQYPTKDKTGYTRAPLGKNALGDLMKEISKKAKLSKIYTNHQIRKTTATAMYKSGFGLKEISNVTKHKNLDSLKHYIGGPTYKDKENYNQALLQYAENSNDEPAPPQQNKRKSDENSTSSEFKKRSNVPKKSCAVPMYPDDSDTQETQDGEQEKNQEVEINDEPTPGALVPSQHQQNQNVIQNQLRQASNLFSSAQFTNCNFTFNLQK